MRLHVKVETQLLTISLLGCSANDSVRQGDKEKELEDELLLRKNENQELNRLSEPRKSNRAQEITARRQHWEAAHLARSV